MNAKMQKLLLPFYFGSVSEDDRLTVERELLTDSEVLTDYLDLKRELEASSLPALEPSSSLWYRLKPKTEKQKKIFFSFSVGAAIAAGLAVFFLFQTQPKQTELIQPSAQRVLFDSSSELPVSSGVL